MNPTAANLETVPPTARAARSSAEIAEFLLEVSDAVNTTLQLDDLLRRVAELVARVIPYQIFAILLLNEKTQEMRMRFQIGHEPEIAEKLRIPVGRGITGQAAQRREAVLVNDVEQEPTYINAHPNVKSELAVPLIVKNRVIGVLDIQSVERDFFTEEHQRLLLLVASRVAQGIENARLYTRAARQAQNLALLNEISRDLTSILNLDQLLERVSVLLRRLIDYQMFSVLLLDATGKKLQHRFSVRYKENVLIKHDIPVGIGLVGSAAQSKEPVLVRDVTKDQRYIALNPETRSELAVPLMYKDQVIGVLDLEHSRKGFFTDDHVRTITTLAAQVAIAIENARLYEHVIQQEQRLERELAMAHELQERLLPACCPKLRSAEISARFVPAWAIGGDMYDFVSYTGGQLGITIGDVSGKGAPAALYAALVSGILRSTAGSEPSPSEMLAAINLGLAERPIAAHFVSLIYAVWDDTTGTMQLANSGLPRPVFCHRGKAQIVQVTGIPCGLFPDADYEEMTIAARPGDVFVLMSDGILDAANAAGDLFGRARLEQVVAASCGGSADEVVRAIFEAVAAHTEGMEPFDDQTVVVLKVGQPTEGMSWSATRG
jgi:sigma-B regulation protein RsbU (phosphoserine phosphatase)